MVDPKNVPIRFSNLRNIARSPAHYLAAISGKQREQTPAMRLGKLVHALVLGGDYVFYDGERRGKAWSEFAAEHDGQNVYTTSERAKAEPMANAVAVHRDASRLIVGETEREVLWKYGGFRQCMAHVDVLAPDWINELKTANDGEPERFGRAALRMGYHAQCAWYLDAARSIDGRKREAYVTIVESSAPYVVTVARLTPRVVEEGQKLCRLWVERLLVCEAAEQWPGYCESVFDLDLPTPIEDDLIFGDGEAA